MLYIQKIKEGSDQGDRIKKNRTSWKRVEYWREKNSGSENNGSLFRWTYYYLEGKLNNGNLFETTLSLKSEKYRSAKKRVNDRVIRYNIWLKFLGNLILFQNTTESRSLRFRQPIAWFAAVMANTTCHSKNSSTQPFWQFFNGKYFSKQKKR